MNMFCYQCEQSSKGSGCTLTSVCGKDPDTAALQDLLIHAAKGISQYAHQARQHGGRDLAIDRFLRPVSYQNLSDALLPPELRDDARGDGVPRLIDGVLTL